MMNKRLTLSGGTLLALALLFIGLTILFNYALRGWRIDLTQNHLYTIAPGTDKIVKGIKEPINLYFFFSEKTANELPQIKTYGVRVRELLEELAARSRGKVRLHVIDPQPFSEDEDRASELGVQGAPVGASRQQLYFGLAGTNATDTRVPPISFFDPQKEQFLEYDVVKLIYQLANPKKPAVGWLSSLPMGQGFDPRTQQLREPWVMYTQAEQLFDVKTIDPGATQIDPEVSVLVLVHPKNLAPATQFAIDQYALRGGHIVAFVDPLAEADQSEADPSNPMAAMQANRSSQLATLLTAWGVQFNPGQVIADRAHALGVSMRQGEPPVQHLGFLGLDKSSFASSDVITAGLSSVNVGTAGYLEPIKNAKTHFEPLLVSSAEAEPLPVQRFAMLFDPSSLRDGFKPTGKRYTLAARVTGNIKTAFPGGPPSGVTLPAGKTALKESAVPFNLVVFADTDMLTNFMWVRESSFFGQRVYQALASNGDLVMNTLDNLAGSSDLISVRGRATFTRPFERVEALRRAADDRYRATEQELERQLRDTEDKLTQLQSKRNDKSSVILTPEQEHELDRFQSEKLRIRKELRAVRAGLDVDIERLGVWVKIVNIIVIPVLFAAAALLAYLWRGLNRKPAASGAAESTSERKEKKP
jgi:ABC-type uncharacterized transport system involved in gliding motility auxiliary subunit